MQSSCNQTLMSSLPGTCSFVPLGTSEGGGGEQFQVPSHRDEMSVKAGRRLSMQDWLPRGRWEWEGTGEEVQKTGWEAGRHWAGTYQEGQEAMKRTTTVWNLYVKKGLSLAD